MSLYLRMGKRALDLAVAGLAALVLMPVALVCGLAMRIASPGPLFYRQQRNGCGGQPFHIWKLRTMHVDGAARLEALLRKDAALRTQYEQEQCLSRDPRVIGWLGRFCRAYSIDEIPQLINVLSGDMSLVGPRPLTTEDNARFLSPLARSARSAVKPGLTGLWQVSRKGKSDISRTLEQMDLYYLQHQSLKLDLLILLRTVPAVLSGGGQY